MVALAVSPNAVTFGSLSVGQTATAQLTVTNSGSSAISVSAVQISGAAFTITHEPTLPATVAANGSLSVTIAFSPTAAGSAVGSATVTSTASSGAASTVSLSGTGVTAAAAPASTAALSSVSCTNASITGAGTDACTVDLTAGAPSGGMAVILRSSDAHVTVPASVTVAAGATSATFTATAVPIVEAQTATLTASFSSASKTYAINLNPPVLSSLTCTDASITGAGTDACTVKLTAPSGGMTVNLNSSDGRVTVPASVTVAAGASSATFTAAAVAIVEAQTATLTASFNGASKTYAINLVPPALSSLSCTDASITGAGTDACTVKLTTGAPSGGMAVHLYSSDAHVTLPSAVTVAAGATSATFTATAVAIFDAQTATLTALLAGASKTYAINLVPPALSSVTCTSAQITGAGTDACTVKLTTGAPSGGFTVNLKSSNAHITLPSAVIVAAGSSTAAFTATATAVTTGTAATITASAVGVSKTYAIDLYVKGVPEMSTLSCASATMTGAGTDACTVKLTANAATGGLKVTLSSNNTNVTVPASVTVAAGASTATFNATAKAVATAATATLTASANGFPRTYAIDLAAVVPSSLSCTSSSITGAGTDACTVKLTAGAPSGGTAVILRSDDAHVTVPASVTVAAGATSATFTATAVAIFDAQTATLTASFGSASKTYAINLNPPVLSSLSCTSASITGAGTDACTVKLTTGAPSGGFTVGLKSSDAHVTLPSAVIVAAGSSTAAFTATATAVTTGTAATLTASAVGVSKTYTIDLGVAAVAALSSVSCTSSSITGAATDACTVKLTANAATGGLKVTLSSNNTNVTVPASVTVAAGASTATFSATALAVPTAATATLTASANSVSKTYAIALVAPALSAVSCTSASLTGAGTDACTVKLTAGAAAGGLKVTLASSSKDVTVPASATVAAGASTASFTATAVAVTTATTATLTASANSVARTYTIDLGATSAGLTLGSTSVAFGNVTLNTPATQTVQLKSSGLLPLVISLGTVTGNGFSIPGVTFPLTLAVGGSTTLDLQFDPTVAGATTGTATLVTNTPSGVATIALTGTGVAPAYSVSLTWVAPVNPPNPVTAYNVYREVSGTTTQTLIGSTGSGTLTYTDDTVADGTTYVYYVVSVDAAGAASGPSNTWTAVIP